MRIIGLICFVTYLKKKDLVCFASSETDVHTPDVFCLFFNLKSVDESFPRILCDLRTVSNQRNPRCWLRVSPTFTCPNKYRETNDMFAYNY